MAQPMYHLIADDLRGQIERGDLRPGAQLPTELELREKYEASRNTIRDAIKRLIGLGLVETRPGQGTFVTQKIDPFVTTLTGDQKSGRASGGEGIAYLSEVSEQHRKPAESTPRVEIQVPSAEVALRLRISPGVQVVSRHQQRFIDDIPWSLQTTYYPMEFVTSGKAPMLLMAEDMAEGTVQYLKKAIGLEQVGYRDWITARTPDSNEQTFFRIPHDSTVFEIFRTGFDQNETPMRVTVTVFPADRNQFIVNVGNVPDPQYDLSQSEPETTEPETTEAEK
ncbi:MAG: GntR family transcriptional regulator [Streptosporangiaceae bacterium]|nr:GntR family transcriptional regulator [Streptosporangiaceae bacterium]